MCHFYFLSNIVYSREYTMICHILSGFKEKKGGGIFSVSQIHMYMYIYNLLIQKALIARMILIFLEKLVLQEVFTS